MAEKMEEKRRYLRLNTELEVEYILDNSDRIYRAFTRDISASGLRFATKDDMKEGVNVEVKLKIPNVQNPIHAFAKIIWIKKIEAAKNALQEVGIEFIKIEEDNKNTFLRYLCDLIYG